MAPPHTTIRTAPAIRETSTTTGTGTLSLDGAVTGFQTFVAGIGTGNLCPYFIRLRNGSEWEFGIGTVTDATPDTLARTTVLRSSNSNAAVNFSAGTKDVWVGPHPASVPHVSTSAPAVTDDNDGSNGVFLPGSLWLNSTTDVLYILVDDTNGAAIWVPLNKHVGNNGAISEKTIASGAITITDSIHTVDTQGDAASDELDTITLSTAVNGSVVYLTAENASRTVWLTGAGNIYCPNEQWCELTTKHYAELIYNASIPGWVISGGFRACQSWKTGTDGATITFGINESPRWTVTLGGNRTLALSKDWTPAVFTIELVQDGTGSRTVTWWSGITWQAGSAPTLTTTAAKKDAFMFLRRASGSYYGQVLAQNY